MIEKKCKICGEWHSSKKIAMHYWNLHRAKYKEYKGNEEERNIVEPITTESINKEEYVLTPQKNDYTAINNVEQNKLNEVIDNEKKTNNQEKGRTKSEQFPRKITLNEIYRSYSKVIDTDILDDGDVINEWC